MMLPRISDEKMKEIIRDASQEDALEDAIIQGIRLALSETTRLEGVLRRREGCASEGGHVFVMRGDNGMVETEIGPGAATRMKWRGSGECENCDAHLGVIYKEKM